MKKYANYASFWGAIYLHAKQFGLPGLESRYWAWNASTLMDEIFRSGDRRRSEIGDLI